MPRPRSATDAEILAGAVRAVSRLGPSRLTLADVAAEVGLAPATLVQRFGSKRGLLLALAGSGGESAREEIAALRARHASPLDALLALADLATRDVETPEALSNHLAFLQVDLVDPDFHRAALEQAEAMREEIRRMLDAAVAAGELAPCDTARLARAVLVTLNGSRLTWAIFREGAVREWVRSDLEAALAPFRAPGRRDGAEGAEAGR